MTGLISNGSAFRLLLLVCALLINGARSYVLQEVPQAFADALQERSSFLGGWAVYTPNACPDQTAACPFKQFCCPTSTVCSILGLGGAAVCCPDQNDCSTYAEAVPSCANTTWSMYEYGGKTSFCCQPGQVGLTDGVCAAKGVAVPATQLASSVAQITGTAAASGAATGAATVLVSGNSAAATGSATTGTAAQGNPVATGTQISPASAGTAVSTSSSSSSSQSGLSGGVIGGIAAGVVVGLIIIALLVYLAFSCGRKRGTREQFPPNQYEAPGMVQNNQMAPPMPSNQSPYPQKYDGYGVQATPVPMSQNSFTPPAPSKVAEFGDNRLHTYDRAELGPAT